MTRHRFFIPIENFSGGSAHLPAGVHDQITKVLRLDAGDQVELLDNLGKGYAAELERDASGKLFGRILESHIVTTEPDVRLTLYFGLTQREKLEWILQKGTEIGVSAFQSFISKRTLVRDEASAQKKHARWEGILREASEQSGRGRIPELKEPLKLAFSLDHSLADNDLTLACWVHEKQKSLAEVFSGQKLGRVGLFTGPEGGFAPEEAEEMMSKGVQMVSLGKRVLRMETAAIVAPALVLYELGEMNAASD